MLACFQLAARDLVEVLAIEARAVLAGVHMFLMETSLTCAAAER